MAKIIVQSTEITVITVEERDYISLTDMANAKEGDSRAADIIKNWLRNRYTLKFLGTWEIIHNPHFKVVEFDHFRLQAGLVGSNYSISFSTPAGSNVYRNKSIHHHLDPSGVICKLLSDKYAI